MNRIDREKICMLSVTNCTSCPARHYPACKRTVILNLPGHEAGDASLLNMPPCFHLNGNQHWDNHEDARYSVELKRASGMPPDKHHRLQISHCDARVSRRCIPWRISTATVTSAFEPNIAQLCVDLTVAMIACRVSVQYHPCPAARGRHRRPATAVDETNAEHHL